MDKINVTLGFHILEDKNGDEIVFKNHATFNNCNCGECPPATIEPVNLGECSNEHYHPYGYPGPMVVKVPVVLSEVKVQIDLEKEVVLNEPAYDIKTIDKKVCITQCHLVPYTNKLFLAGYVQKNIQYSTVDQENANSFSGDIRHHVINADFRCVTAVKFTKQPNFGKSYKSKSNVLDYNMVCKDEGEDNWIHYNQYFEPIFCEVEWTKILETDIFNRNNECLTEFSAVNCFTNFIEKMVVYIDLKVLQTQQVFIPEPDCEVKVEKHYEDKNYEDNHNSCDYYDDIEVSCIPGKGMVARPIKRDKY
ncbi:CsxC family protein [Clostridium tunisiense]|uniref:CsxC family protein n=1 Tax=Clostridium tunisiense TaxID=219748 RepID=UPI00031D61F1|nr:hypothetical protein [Clostridium tunisiense]